MTVSKRTHSRLPRGSFARGALLVAVLAAGDLAFAGVASANTGIGSTGCTIGATKPAAGAPHVVATATIRCASEHVNERLESCVQQLVGSWQTIASTCVTSPPLPGKAAKVYVDFSARVSPVKGRTYRSWAWGYVNGPTATAISRATKY